MENGEWRRKSCDYSLLLAQRESFKNAINEDAKGNHNSPFSTLSYSLYQRYHFMYST